MPSCATPVAAGRSCYCYPERPLDHTDHTEAVEEVDHHRVLHALVTNSRGYCRKVVCYPALDEHCSPDASSSGHSPSYGEQADSGCRDDPQFL